jgi:hypothetical protein
MPHATNHGTGRAPNNINGGLEPEAAHAEPYPCPHVAEHQAGCWTTGDPTTDDVELAPDTEDEIEREENEGGGQHG